MSILIKGMTFPKDGAYLATLDISVEDGYAMINIPNVGTFYLAEVPTPHGRLIDADALYQPLADAYGAFSIGAIKGSLVGQTIKAAPTIIEAEESSHADTTD